MTGDTNVMWTVFGPVNVGLHAVSVEMEMGEAGEALRLADDIDVSGSPSLERQTTFALEVARCYEQKRDDPGVFLHLVNAEASGPEDMRYNTLARDLVHGLLKRARPTYAPQVHALARRIERVELAGRLLPRGGAAGVPDPDRPGGIGRRRRGGRGRARLPRPAGLAVRRHPHLQVLAQRGHQDEARGVVLRGGLPAPGVAGAPGRGAAGRAVVALGRRGGLIGSQFHAGSLAEPTVRTLKL